MTDANTICHDLDLLGDWLDAKGYTEEAGLVLRALSLIHKLQDGVRSTIQERDVLSGENFGLRAENKKLREALAPFVDAGHFKVVTKAGTTEEYNQVSISVREHHLRAAAALKETGDE